MHELASTPIRERRVAALPGRPGRPVLPLLAAATAVLLLAACGSGGGGGTAADSTASPLTAAQRAQLHVLTVQPDSFRPSVTTSGTVAFDGDRSTQVLAPISGPVSRILVSLGTRVTRGQPLAIVTSPDFAGAVADYRKGVA
ncbi:MAG TPA: efflux RND transporter periplasmic adaptor subunit, partial [Gemmatimonadota bacterium]|nr:efflux RND transporter periplasmic adaptor subunit [Gemmatimonadota bacterium]